MAPSTANDKCRVCGKKGNVSTCTLCKLVDYCGRECQTADWKSGHKILCKRVPKAVKNAEEKLNSFRLSDYTTRNVGTFMVTEAQAQRGEIIEEQQAQDLCYDAMEMRQGSPEKLQEVLRALEFFPLSTEAWGMLGHFYLYELAENDSKKKSSAAAALKMYDNAIKSSRILNPSWKEDRSEELPWGEINNRPHLRSLHGRAVALKNMGKRSEAIAQAKKIMRLNPNDNQGIRQLLCTWFLEARDTEGCTNLLRKYDTITDTSLAYTDVLLQFLRWKKDDVVENEVKEALYNAIQANPFVPDLLGIDGIQKMEDGDPYFSLGSAKEATSYVTASRKLWGKYPDSVEWIKQQKFAGGKVPSENILIDLLKSGVHFQIKCVHTDLNGADRKNSYLIGTQKRNQCVGSALADFHWPRTLNRQHEPSSDILIHENDFDKKGIEHWRKTKFVDVVEVPFWRILAQFHSDDEKLDNSRAKALLSPMNGNKARTSYSEGTPLKCKECSSPAKFCALDNDSTDFYCSKSCMSNYLEETDPPYFDLTSPTLKIHVTDGCSISTIDLDSAFKVAGEHMSQLNSVDIFLSQIFLLKDKFNFGNNGRKVLLSANCLKQFLEKKKESLESFSFCLDDCCWEELKKLTNRCKAFIPLGDMRKLKKIDLTNFGFDDVETLTSCLSTSLLSLCLDNVKMSPNLEWKDSDVNSLVEKLSRLKNLKTLSLADIALTDRHLSVMLPSLKSLCCLDVSGRFGTNNNFWEPRTGPSLTDKGVEAIAKNCPKLMTVVLNYQYRVTMNGIRLLLKKCPGLLELEAGEIKFEPKDFAEIFGSAKNLLFFSYGKIGFGNQSQQEQVALQNAVKASNGRVVVCTESGGRIPFSLSSTQKKNQDKSMETIEKAHEQLSDPAIWNKWDGIL